MFFLVSFSILFCPFLNAIELHELNDALKVNSVQDLKNKENIGATDLYDFLSTHPDQLNALMETKNPKLIVPMVDLVEKLLLENEHILLYRIMNHPLAVNWDQSFNEFYYMGISEIEYLTQTALGKIKCFHARICKHSSNSFTSVKRTPFTPHICIR